MNKAEFTQMYEANYRRVHNYIGYRIGDLHAVEDVVSLVFMRAIEKHASFDPHRGTAEMWLIGIARNAVTDHLRDRAKRQCADIDALSATLPSGEMPVDQRIIARDDQRRLLSALQCLNDRERQVISLRYGAELTNRKIAQLTGLSAANVGVILFRSLRKLRKTLEKEVRP